MKIYKNLVGYYTFKELAASLSSDPAVENAEEPANPPDNQQQNSKLEFKLPAPSKDPDHALQIYAGTDNTLKIGEPNNAGMRQNLTIEQLWQESCELIFKKDEEDHTGGDVILTLAKWPDEKVDLMRVQKDKELDDYRRDIER